MTLRQHVQRACRRYEFESLGSADITRMFRYIDELEKDLHSVRAKLGLARKRKGRGDDEDG